jgi:succinate dehydrogenase / fumarate reductase cytochrome b subunit
MRTTTVLTAPAPVAPRVAAPALVRLFSLAGVVPLGAFLLVHVGINASVLWGTAAFARAEDAILTLPALGLFETVFVFAPLALHAGLGAWWTLTRTPLPPPSPAPPAVTVATRVTGLVGLVFIVDHVIEQRFGSFHRASEGGAVASELAATLSATAYGVPWRGVAYLIGMACVVFHFSVGLWTWCTVHWPLQTAAARRRAAWALAAVGSATWLTGANAIVVHATGARPFAGGDRDPPTEPCPPIERH